MRNGNSTSLTSPRCVLTEDSACLPAPRPWLATWFRHAHPTAEACVGHDLAVWFKLLVGVSINEIGFAGVSKGMTMRDIAREVGVSIASVSHAYNNQSEISAELRDRIMRVAAAHD